MLTRPLPARRAREDADCLIVKHVRFIDRAREESVNTILELARLKERGRCTSLIVTGCLTQRYGLEIKREMPEIDAISGTSGLERIVDLVRQADNRRDWATSAPPGYLYDAKTPRLLTARVPYAYGRLPRAATWAAPSARSLSSAASIAAVARRHRERGRRAGRARRAGGDSRLPGHARLRQDLAGNGDIGDLLIALGETRMPWIRPMYLHPPTSTIA